MMFSRKHLETLSAIVIDAAEREVRRLRAALADD